MYRKLCHKSSIT